MTVTREESREETKSGKEAEYERKTDVDEVLGEFIRRRKSYNMSFQVEVFITYEDMNSD